MIFHLRGAPDDVQFKHHNLSDFLSIPEPTPALTKPAFMAANFAPDATCTSPIRKAKEERAPPWTPSARKSLCELLCTILVTRLGAADAMTDNQEMIGQLEGACRPSPWLVH
jgi:hypothetical protein